MARLLSTQLRSNTGRSETWQAVSSSLHARAHCVFTSPSASVNLHNPDSQLNRQPRWQPFISPSDCRQLSPTAKEWGCHGKKGQNTTNWLWTEQASLKAGAGLWRAKTTVEVEALVRTDERTAKQRQCVCSWEGIFQNANQCSDIESAKCQLRCYTNREFSLGPVTVHFLIINTSLQEISTEIVHSLSQMYTFIPKTQKQTNK